MHRVAVIHVQWCNRYTLCVCDDSEYMTTNFRRPNSSLVARTIESSAVTLFLIHSFIHNYKVSLNSRETLTKNSLIALNNIVKFVSLLCETLWIICLCSQCTRISASCHRFCTSSHLMHSHSNNRTPANTKIEPLNVWEREQGQSFIFHAFNGWYTEKNRYCCQRYSSIWLQPAATKAAAAPENWHAILKRFNCIRNEDK